MARAIDLRTNDYEDLTLRWSRRVSLTWRILAVNVFAIAMLAGGFLYLDSYRARIVQERLDQSAQAVWSQAHILSRLDTGQQLAAMAAIGNRVKARYRLYGLDGTKRLDSFDVAGPSYSLRDPDKEPWERDAARFLDQAFDAVVDAPRIENFNEPAIDRLDQWPEALTASDSTQAISKFRYAADRTPIISAAAAIPGNKGVLLVTSNARDITRIVRAERFNLSLIIFATMLISVLLSLFLARTIVRPLRRLAKAAVRVRLGRAREVVVPRLPSRGDEIGMLARALSDMSLALRQKIDATEAFAADVSHELKNPIASLRSALDGLEVVKDDKLRAQLLAIASSDVLRLDRLITDISEASRLDAQLTRTRFEPVDIGEMIENLLAAREQIGLHPDREIAFARPRRGVAVTMGEGIRLERVFNNLLDNALSFSPKNGVIQISATRAHDQIVVRVMDQGPGVPQAEREAIFRRFHSVRPVDESFGAHSGLGLAIARTIIEGHHGKITISDRDDGQPGACFEVVLPAFGASPIQDPGH